MSTPEEQSTGSDRIKTGFRLFRPKEDGGAPADGAAAAGTDPVIRKTKSFKRIRGFLSGETRKERRERKKSLKAAPGTASSSAPSATTTATASGPDDASTVYQVDVDDRSVLTSRSSPTSGAPTTVGEAAKGGSDALGGAPDAAAAKKPYLLKVVLLLMDPETRRFELLQLEFDSLKALVSDVLSQIHVSVTEESLRVKTYTAITNRDGVDYRPDQLLSSFCKGNDILVAVPAGTTAKDCSRLARPILSDDKVVSMLLSSGIDAKAWREKKKKRRSNPKTTRALEDGSEGGGAAGGSSSAKTVTILVVVLAAIALQVFHMYISTAIKPGHIVSPGIWLTKCGILGVLPPPMCEGNDKLVYSDEGMVTLLSADGTPLWEMQGGVCAPEDAEAGACVPGLHVKDDNTIVIGGKTVYTVRLFDADAELSPWPFAEPPKLTIRLSKKY